MCSLLSPHFYWHDFVGFFFLISVQKAPAFFHCGSLGTVLNWFQEPVAGGIPCRFAAFGGAWYLREQESGR